MEGHYIFFWNKMCVCVGEEIKHFISPYLFSLGDVYNFGC
jgi:hypothetical protein